MRELIKLDENNFSGEILRTLPPTVDRIEVDLDHFDKAVGELLETPQTVQTFVFIWHAIALEMHRYTAFGLICYEDSKYDLAERFFDKRLTRQANDSTALCYLAKLKMELEENYTKAAELLFEAEKHEPNNIFVYLAMSDLAMRQQAVADSLRNFAKLQTLLTPDQFKTVITKYFSVSIFKYLSAQKNESSKPTEPHCTICFSDIETLTQAMMVQPDAHQDAQQHAGFQVYHSQCLFKWLSQPGHERDPNTNLAIRDIVRPT